MTQYQIYDELDIGGVCAPIVAEDHNKKETNCYAVQSDTYTDTGLTNIITLADMKSADFVEKLEEKWRGSVLSAWMVDKDGINGGLPVTVADYNYANGKYKIQPELWDA